MRRGEFYRWHVDSGPGPLSQRQLVAIWYLNTVSESGGATEFFHQRVQVRPEAGKLLLFPPFWTHLHQGETVGAGSQIHRDDLGLFCLSPSLRISGMLPVANLGLLSAPRARRIR
ncbi:MAG: 2OG-Fe(II) oxygenase [Arenicellales bacterium]